MTVAGIILPGASRWQGSKLNYLKKARQRLKCFDYYDPHSHNAHLTCRYFGKSLPQFHFSPPELWVELSLRGTLFHQRLA